MADAVRARLHDCSVIDGDSFYAGGTSAEWDRRSARMKADRVIDWRRQRPVLTDVRAGRRGSWFGFDWEAFDGRLESQSSTVEPAAVVILEGAYSARPELADLLDLRVLLDVDEEVRRARLRRREGDEYHDDWYERWAEAEDWYFGSTMPPSAFDLVV